MQISKGYLRYAMTLLFLISALNFLDRFIISILLEPIKAEFQLSDTQLGLMSGVAFAILYATLGVPIARWADVGNRRTIISLALGLWSAMTALCGLAGSFTTLLLARVGVGVGEAGATPPAHSLISDYYPAAKRPGALAIFTFGGTLGTMLAFVGGGLLAQEFGWRLTLLVIGLPGVLLALLARYTLPEPRLVDGMPVRAGDEGMADNIMVLLRKPAYRQLCAALALYGFVAYGAVQWFAPFLMRSYGLSIGEVGVKFGLVMSLASALGVLAGGVLGNRFAAHSVRWLAWLPALCCAGSWPLYLYSFFAPGLTPLLVVVFIAGVMLGAMLPMAYAAVHAVSGAARRATGIAVSLFFLNIVGLGLGPLAVGILSDGLAATFGAESLRYALAVAFTILLWAAWHFWLAAGTLQADSED